MSSDVDLRSFLESTRATAPREYLVVEREVSPAWEMAAVVAKLEAAHRAPIIEFSHVTGTEYRVVTNVNASLHRIARSLGMAAEELELRVVAAYDEPQPPRRSDPSEAPVRERVWEREEIDLRRFPQIRYTEVETAPYLTATSVVARDPVTGALNISYHRLMVVDRTHTGIFMVPGGHLDRIVARNAQHGRDTPVAVFWGVHPLWALGCLAAGAPEVDEFAVIGGLLRKPLDVVPTLTHPDLLVPARAEISMEGFIRHGERIPEGPFGEFAGYAASRELSPVLEISLISQREDAIFQDIVAGRLEHLTMSGAALRGHLRRSVVRAHGGILDLYLPAPMTLFLRVDKSALDVEVPRLLEDVLRSQPYLKQVYCFDADIDLRSLQSTQWALATRLQPDRDIVVLSGRMGTGLDPSEAAGLTAKWGIDATAKPDLEHFAPRNRIPAQVLDRVDVTALLTR